MLEKILFEDVYNNLRARQLFHDRGSAWLEWQVQLHCGDIYEMLDFLGYDSLSEYVWYNRLQVDMDTVKDALRQVFEHEDYELVSDCCGASLDESGERCMGCFDPCGSEVL